MNRKRQLVTALAGAALALAALTGCSTKQVDLGVTGATPVPGTGNLYRFCDGATLIYFSNWGLGVNDEYEFIVYDGCAKTVPPQHGVQNLPDSDN